MSPFLFQAFLALENSASTHLFPLSHQELVLPMGNLPLPLDVLLEFSEVLLFLNYLFLSVEQSFLLAENPLFLEHQTGVLLPFLQILTLVILG